MKISIIVAMGKSHQIGLNNKIPWRLKSDFKHFKETTMGGTLIMGRKTFESIPGGPLPGRTTIVLTRDLKKFDAQPSHYMTTNIYSALDLAWSIDKDVWLCGGAEVYREGLKFADELIVSSIDWDEKADTYFPDYVKLFWKLYDMKFYPKEDTGDSHDWVLRKYKRAREVK